MIGVCIVTYNQEKYIAQAIESVLNQQPCGHTVIAYIGEDHSTDNTGAICDEFALKYPDQVVVCHNKTNLGLVNNTLTLLERMQEDQCDYIAMLDGDDYWTDPFKLKKQIDCFKDHPDCGLVHTAADTLFPQGLLIDDRTSFQYGNVFDIIEKYDIGNCTVVFKADLLNMIDFNEFRNQHFMSVDYVMYACFSSQVPFAYLSDHTAIWRRGHESVSNSKDMQREIAYIQNDLAIWRYLAKRFPDRWKYDDSMGENYLHTRCFHVAFKHGDRKLALNEAKGITEKDKKLRIKIIAAHSIVLFSLWRFSNICRGKIPLRTSI